jgi:hypothetical protein
MISQVIFPAALTLKIKGEKGSKKGFDHFPAAVNKL